MRGIFSRSQEEGRRRRWWREGTLRRSREWVREWTKFPATEPSRRKKLLFLKWTRLAAADWVYAEIESRDSGFGGTVRPGAQAEYGSDRRVCRVSDCKRWVCVYMWCVCVCVWIRAVCSLPSSCLSHTQSAIFIQEVFSFFVFVLSHFCRITSTQFKQSAALNTVNASGSLLNRCVFILFLHHFTPCVCVGGF